MKYYRNIWLLASPLILVLSCGTPTSNDGNESMVELLLEASILKPFDQVASKISFIELKQPENEFINLGCDQHLIHVQGDSIWFADRCYPQMSLHLFLRDGRHIKSWNKRGESPGEYRSIHGWQFHDDQLWINSGNGKVLEYSLPNFQYSQTINLGNYTFLSDFRPLDNGRFLIAPELESAIEANETFPLFYILDTMSMEKKALPIRGTMLSTEINEGKICSFEDGYLLSYGMSDTIFQFSDDTVMPHIRLNFGKKAMTKGDLQSDDEALFHKVFEQQSVAFNSGEIAYSPKDQLIRIKTFGLLENPELDMTDRKTFPFQDIFINADHGATGFPALVEFGNNVGMDNNGYFYEVLQYEDGQNLIENGLLGKYTSEYQKLINEKVEPEDPVILRYKVNF